MRRPLLIGVSALVVVGAAGAERRSGQLISFWSDRAGSPGVWVMGVDGSDQRLLTGDLHAKRGSFSPDGATVVFDGPVGGQAGVAVLNFDLYLMQADGSRLRRLTSGPQRDVLATWAPSGTTIAFTRLATRRATEYIWLVRPDGTALRRLAAGAAPVWSPDGASIAFGRFEGSGASVYVMDAAGGHVHRLTGSGSDAAPSDWSPDGRRILFTRWDAGRGGEIWAMNTDGKGQRRLTRNPADDFDATWSPDGSRILFTSDRAGSKDVWAMNADGTHPQRLTTASSEDWATDWQP